MSTGEYKRVLARMQAGDEREIVRNGPISIYARCATTGAYDELRMFAKTDVDGAIMLASWGDTLDGTNANDFLNTATPEAAREWESSADGNPGSSGSAITPTGMTKIVDHYDDDHFIAPTGDAISWESEAELRAGLALDLSISGGRRRTPRLAAWPQDRHDLVPCGRAAFTTAVSPAAPGALSLGPMSFQNGRGRHCHDDDART